MSLVCANAGVCENAGGGVEAANAHTESATNTRHGNHFMEPRSPCVSLCNL